MDARQTLPNLWLLSDARNDAALERSLAALPPGSGFVFRHYHLADGERRKRFEELAMVCRANGHFVALASGNAREWGADGVYGRAEDLAAQAGLLRFATVHDAQEIAAADRAGVDAMFLSPVFPTRSHPQGKALGGDRFLALAALAKAPVIALGGMDAARAEELGWPRWAAIDGLTIADS